MPCFDLSYKDIGGSVLFVLFLVGGLGVLVGLGGVGGCWVVGEGGKLNR